jgi:hypothetical protein
MKLAYLLKKLPKITLLLLCVQLVGCTSFSHLTYSEAPKQLSKATKHNAKIPRLTYYIHKGDSTLELKIVSVQKTEETTEISGYQAELNPEKITLYESMSKDSKYEFTNEEEKLIGNQVHLFVSDYKFESGTNKITVTQEQTKRYELFQNGREGSPRLLRGIIIGLIVTAGLAGIFFGFVALIGSLVWG